MKRTIIINESQLPLIEKLVKETHILDGTDDTNEYGKPGKISVSASIHDRNGKPKQGKPVAMDRISTEIGGKRLNNCGVRS